MAIKGGSSPDQMLTFVKYSKTLIGYLSAIIQEITFAGFN
jgi:hypothetical protein